jgi:hypothetical protein
MAADGGVWAVREQSIRADPSQTRPTIPVEPAGAEDDFIFEWATKQLKDEDFAKFKAEANLMDMTADEWWSKIQENAAMNEAKGIRFPDYTLDLTTGG